MKRTNPRILKIEEESEPSITCSCQILNDTSLSNVGDSDCDCSECLQANLNAYNQFKNQQENNKKTKYQGRGRSVKLNNYTNVGQSGSRPNFKSTEKTVKIKSNKKERQENINTNLQQDLNIEEKNWDDMGEGLNQFLLVTKHRTRQYLEQRKKLQKEDEEEKNKLKDQIKMNLEVLKYNSMINQNSNPNELEHPFKWNHSLYKCKGKADKLKHNCCRWRKEKQKLDTGLDRIKENFKENRDQILEQNKEKRKAELSKKDGVCPYDFCPNHHNRTEKNKIKKIQKFIKKQAKKYQKQILQQKNKQTEAKKIKQAKLRAIDIKSKQIVKKSIKIDDTISKTSFKLSIDHYNTFSELKQQNQVRKRKRQAERQVKINLKKGGYLQQKIYEELDEEMPNPGQNIILRRTTKAMEGSYDDGQEKKQYSQKILRDASIVAPGLLRKKEVKTEKEIQSKKKTNLSKGKEEEKKKKLNQEIDRKKKEIMQEYVKRNSVKQPMNKQLREEYERRGSKKGGSRKQVTQRSAKYSSQKTFL